MGKKSPCYLIFAGVNGAGKTTLYRSNQWESPYRAKDFVRVNPDEILRDFHGNPSSAKDQMKAAKVALEMLDECFESNTSICQETTLCGHSILKNIKKARTLGYCISLIFVGVESAGIAQERVAYRAKIGGHNIVPALIESRFRESLVALSRTIDYCDQVCVFDNTRKYEEIVEWRQGMLNWWGISPTRGSWFADVMDNKEIWQR